MSKTLNQRNQHTIYVLAPDFLPPSGGIRHLYRHVDVLCANGFNAVLVHKKRPFRCSWFPNTTQIEYINEIRPRPTDFIVAAEVLGPRLHEIGKGAKTVVLNQNAYYTFSFYSVAPEEMTTAYNSPVVVGCIVVSDDNFAYLRYPFPNLKLYRMHYSVDPRIFYPREKRLQICFMPRKNPDDAVQVLNLLKFRGALSGVAVTLIDGATEAETARILGESLVFLSFGFPEGFGLPPLEAMASGCIVIGYHGNGGKEYLKRPFAFPIEAGDILGFARCVEAVLGEWKKNSTSFMTMTQRAVQFAHSNYSPARQEADIVQIWDHILATNQS